MLPQVTYEIVKGHPIQRIYEFSIIEHPDKEPPMSCIPDLEGLSPTISYQLSTAAHLDDNFRTKSGPAQGEYFKPCCEAHDRGIVGDIKREAVLWCTESIR